MTYNPDFILDLGEKKIPLLFNTRTFIDFSKKMGIEYEGLIDLVLKDKLARNSFPDLLFLGAQSWHRHNKTPFSATEDDAIEWVDELPQGLATPCLLEMFKAFAAKLFCVDVKDLEVGTKENAEEKNAVSL